MFAGSPPFSVVFWPCGCFSDSLPLWGAIAWPFRPFYWPFWCVMGHVGPLLAWSGLSWTVLPVCGHSCPIQRASGPCTVRNSISLMVTHPQCICYGAQAIRRPPEAFFWDLVPLVVVVFACVLATIWRSAQRVNTTNEPICTSSVTLPLGPHPQYPHSR